MTWNSKLSNETAGEYCSVLFQWFENYWIIGQYVDVYWAAVSLLWREKTIFILSFLHYFFYQDIIGILGQLLFDQEQVNILKDTSSFIEILSVSCQIEISEC